MSLNKHLANIIGKKSKQKYIVFEVDDYGEVNITNHQTISRLTQKNIKPTFFQENDRPGSISEMSALFEILSKYKGADDKPVIFSPQVITANPDFEAIKKSDFQEYHYKTFIDGLMDYQGIELYNLWKQAENEGLWSPELHGREHLNVALWMDALHKKQSKTREAFNENVYGIFDKESLIPKMKLTEAFNIKPNEDLNSKITIARDAIAIFKTAFNRSPTLFTPPASKYFYEMEPVLYAEKVKVISVSRFHNYPNYKGDYKKVFRYPGQKSKSGIMYSVRNCQFEPHSKNRKDWVDSCLSDINTAFMWNNAAIISSHRINFVNQNPDGNNGLKQLEDLIKQIVKKWPDCIFISSKDLYQKW